MDDALSVGGCFGLWVGALVGGSVGGCYGLYEGALVCGWMHSSVGGCIRLWVC